MSKRVWILGAGFSRSLGAPLLADLLSLRTRDRIRMRYSNMFVNQRVYAQVYALYHHGINYREGFFHPANGRPLGSSMWKDAEDFLETLDLASTDAVVQSQLAQHWEQFRTVAGAQDKHLLADAQEIRAVARADLLPPVELAAAARRLVAAECCEFMTTVSPRSERAIPYVAWGERLDGDDTIVTYNYDRVVETMVGEKVIVAGLDASVSGCVERAKYGGGQPLLFKLHGSVDWRIPEDESIEHFEKCEPDPNQHTFAPAIGTPGNSKLSFSTKPRGMPLWGYAAERLRTADQVFVVGYGLPESDAKAREFLLKSLGENPNPTSVKIVLGFDADRARRLREMIETAGVQTFSIETPLLYAQDFLQGFAVNSSP